jgi:tetratricopeptide (TPR) repeat protein
MVTFRGPGEGDSSDRAKWSFGQLLDWHLLRGTRRGGKIDQAGRKWSTKELADAIGVQPRTIRYWKKNEHLPTEIETLERVLFGADACYAEWRLELRHAHAITQGAEIGAVTSASFEPNRDLWAGNTLPAFNIPIRVPLHFMGRDDALAAIDTALARQQGRVAITALHGLRGVGKTTLAAAYAERHRSDYRAIWWIRAQTEPTMRTDLVALGVRLGWVGREDKEEPAFTAVMDGLRNDGEGILLIFDNAIDADKLKSYLPSGGAARVVVTSNTHAWRRLAEPVEIRLWPKNIGADYLVARTGREGERQAAEALSEALGGLPLAHEQAAAYCERLETSLAEYIKRFNAAPARLLDDNRDAPAEHNDGMTVAKSFALAIEEATKLHPAAEPLIVYAALLAPEPVPLFLFAEAREKLGDSLSSALAGEGLDEAVAALRTFALVGRNMIVDERDSSISTDTILLHPLVREIASRRAEDTRDDARRALLEALATLYPKEVYDEPKSWPRARRLDEHGRALVGNDATPPKGGDERASQLLDRLASYRHGALSAYASAQPLFERALLFREKVLGAEHPLTAMSFNNLARLLWDRGDLAGAQPLFERALAIREKVLGPEHPHTAASLNNLASLLQFRGDLAGAQPLFERALTIREKVLGPDHPHTAAALNNVARVLRDRAEFARARPFSERALAIRERVLGPEHPRTAASLNNLASLLQGQGEFTAARPLFERALAICEKALGPDHPYTATSLTNLALLFQAQGDIAGARLFCERALIIREKVLGPRHPSTATSLNDLGNLLSDQGDLARAQPVFERALVICEEVYGPGHPSTATSLNGLANLLLDRRDLAGARLLYERALKIREKTLGPKHPATAIIRNNLSQLPSAQR